MSDTHIYSSDVAFTPATVTASLRPCASRGSSSVASWAFLGSRFTATKMTLSEAAVALP